MEAKAATQTKGKIVILIAGAAVVVAVAGVAYKLWSSNQENTKRPVKSDSTAVGLRHRETAPQPVETPVPKLVLKEEGKDNKEKEKEKEEVPFTPRRVFVQSIEDVDGVLEALHGLLKEKSIQGDGPSCEEELSFVVECMQTHHNKAIAVVCCKLVNWYCTKSRFASSNKERLDQLGIVDLTLETMERFVDSAQVQSAACGVLGNMAGIGGYYMRQDIAKKGGIAAIFKAIQTNKGKVGVYEMALFALGNLCTMNDDNRRKMVKEKTAAAADIIGHVIHAMKAHLDKPTFIESACFFLGNVAGDKEIKMLIGRKHGLSMLQAVLEKYADNKAVMSHATYALDRIVIDADK